MKKTDDEAELSNESAFVSLSVYVVTRKLTEKMILDVQTEIVSKWDS